MELFKAILKIAIKYKAVHVALLSGQKPDFKNLSLTSSESQQFQALQSVWIDQIVASLFPKRLHEKAYGSDVFEKESLVVQGLGQIIILIAASGQLHLFFPPSGEEAAESFIKSLNMEKKSDETPFSGLSLSSLDFASPEGLGLDDSSEKLDASVPMDLPSAPAAEEPFTPQMQSIPFSFSSLPVSEPKKNISEENIETLPSPSFESFTPPEFLKEESFLAPPSVSLPDVPEMPSFQAPSMMPPAEEASHSHESFDPSHEMSTPSNLVEPVKIVQKTESSDFSSSLPNLVSNKIDYSSVLPGSLSVSEGQLPIDKILKEMLSKKASDLHMTGSEPIIFRIDGDITRMPGDVLDPAKMEFYLDPIIPAIKRQQFKDTWDIDFAYELRNVGRFRVNMFRDHMGVGAVLRHIPDRVLSADELGLSEGIRKFCHLAKGLVLVTGPTGSGKSTTLAAMIDLINETRSDHILTIEDPIEFVHPQKKCLINQREVTKHTAGFKAALKAALREDPDIVLVGEMRDLETTAMAIETAETGHLVFGTLHTNSAISTVDRVIDQFPSEEQRIIRSMLASSLKGVISQTLCKKIGGGRCAAHEVLVPNEAVGAMIREGKIHMIANHMQTAQQDGNVLMVDALLNLVQQGKVNYWDAWRKANDKKEFQDATKRRNIIPPKT